jgi:hypothetical protein
MRKVWTRKSWRTPLVVMYGESRKRRCLCTRISSPFGHSTCGVAPPGRSIGQSRRASARSIDTSTKASRGASDSRGVGRRGCCRRRHAGRRDEEAVLGQELCWRTATRSGGSTHVESQSQLRNRRGVGLVPSLLALGRLHRQSTLGRRPVFRSRRR